MWRNVGQRLQNEISLIRTRVGQHQVSFIANQPAVIDQIEVETARRPGRLIAVRVTLDDAMYVAESIHPGVGEVTIREVALPCDADTFCASTSRTWSRGPEGGFRLRP